MVEVEQCMVAIHNARGGLLTIRGHGWVRIRRGRIVDGQCTGLTEYLLMRAFWEQTGF
ncbi:hypothetical protein [Paraburkholderia sp. SIMBA_054]|uniref:hypothetical protein n=1 Tax=Paraburkholderia sp. SIMBA_054 TaxID=3085795 RepID=UPI00397B37B6